MATSSGRGPGRPSNAEKAAESSNTAGPVVERMLAAAAPGDRLEVSRFNPAGGTWNYCGGHDPAGVAPIGAREFLRQCGGGGKYQVRLRRHDGTYGPSVTLSVDGLPKPWDDAGNGGAASSSSSSSSSAAAPAAAPAGSAWVQTMLQPIAAAFGTALAGFLVKKLLEDKQPDPILMELLRQSRGGGAAIDPVELTRLVMDAETRGETRGAETGKLRAIASRADRGEGSSSGALGALDRGLPKVIDLISRKMELDERRAGMGRTTTARGAAGGEQLEELENAGETPPLEELENAGAQSSSAAAPAAAPADPLVTVLLGVPMMARRFLLNAAENDEPAEIYGPMIVAKLDELTYRRMPALLERPDFVDVFCREWPAFAAHRDFVSSLRESMAATLEASLQAEQEEDEESAGDGSSSSSSSSNAAGAK